VGSLLIGKHYYKVLIMFRDYQELLWQHTFSELNESTKDNIVIHTETVFNTQVNREKMTQLMFEKFSFSAMYVAMSAVLSIFASGRTTGVVLESGIVTSSVPVYEGHALPLAMLRMEFGGRELDDCLLRFLAERDSRNHMYDITQVKEKLCYVALDFDLELKKTDLEASYELPDGTLITASSERFKCPEALFQPRFIRKLYCNTLNM
jgi:actin